MLENVHVMIVEDDHFASNWMSLLLARDWRTHVSAEAATTADLKARLKSKSQKFHLILLDTEMPGDPYWLKEILAAIAASPNAPAVLLTGTHASEQKLLQCQAVHVRGFILKDEIRFSLAWAVALAMEWQWVLTPGVEAMMERAGLPIPRPYAVMDGRNTVRNLTTHELNAARLAFLFSMERRELADELAITEDWSFGLVSKLYEKLGLDGLISGEVEPQAYLGAHPTVLEHFEKIVTQARESRKARDMEALAFHLLTMPEITPCG